jgi:hypothetical protein
MTQTTLSFYAADFDRDVFEFCLHDGVVLGAMGIVNLLWEDFSALEVAKDAHLEGVVWDAVKDNMPGSLTLSVLYALTPDQVMKRFQGKDWLDCEFIE